MIEDIEDRYTESLVTNGEFELVLCLNWLKREGYIPAFISETDLYVPGHGRLRALILDYCDDGWIADLLLDDVAPGIPEVIETPDSMCAIDENTARRRGWQLVANLVNANLTALHQQACLAQAEVSE